MKGEQTQLGVVEGGDVTHTHTHTHTCIQSKLIIMNVLGNPPPLPPPPVPKQRGKKEQKQGAGGRRERTNESIWNISAALQRGFDPRTLTRGG